MLMGVKTEMLQVGVSVYSCALAGMGGALYAGLYSLEPSMGALFILKGVEAAILAGVGNLAGALGRRDHSRGDRVDRLALSCRRLFATPTDWSSWWPSCCSGRADCSGARNERRLAAVAALSRPGREPQRGPAHDPHLHLHPRHPGHRLQHRVRLCRPADDVPRRRLRDRRLRHVSDPHQVRRFVLAGAAADVCRHPGSVAAGGMDLLQVQAARVLFCGRDAGLLRARPARRAQLEQRHERDAWAFSCSTSPPCGCRAPVS